MTIGVFLKRVTSLIAAGKMVDGRERAIRWSRFAASKRSWGKKEQNRSRPGGHPLSLRRPPAIDIETT